METKTLQMDFKTDKNKNYRLTINDPLGTLGREEVEESMDLILGQGVFQVEDQDITSKSGAKFITRRVEDIF